MGILQIDYFEKNPRKRIRCNCDYAEYKKEFHIKYKKNNSKHYKSILRHMEIDTKQNEWCRENDIKLIRITDKDFNPYRVMDIKNKYLQENVKKLIETKVK
jgi:hypothetical protein